jgi:hypothetical protein
MGLSFLRTDTRVMDLDLFPNRRIRDASGNGECVKIVPLGCSESV